jgi:hypothetical protein
VKTLPVFVLVVMLAWMITPVQVRSQDTPYDFTLTAFCELTQTEVSVQIWMDGSWTEYRTPYTFTGLVGHHQFNVPFEDEHGHFVYPLWPPGSGIDVSGAWSFQFSYAATPSVYSMGPYSLFVGRTIRMSILLGISDNTTQSSIGYRIEGPEYNPRFPPSVIDQGSLTLVGSLFTINITVPQDTHVGSYTFKIDGVTRGISWRNYSEMSWWSIDVIPAPLNPRVYEPLPLVSKFTAGSVEYNYYENPYTHAAVIYVGGGMLGGVVGSGEIHGGGSVGDLYSGSYRLVYNLVINGFSVATPSSNWDGADFPAQAAEYLKGQGRTDIYILGFSGGGTVAAYQIMNYPSLYEKAVISDAVLTKESGQGFNVADLAPKAGQVTTPHCLIWGEADSHAPLTDAEAWLANASPGLAQLHVYNYYHEWFNTSHEPAIIENIINFFNGKLLFSQAVNFISPYGDVSSYTFQIRTNGAVSNVAYDGQHLTLSIEKPQGGDDVFMVPKSMLNGDVSIQVDGQEAAVNRIENSTDYFFYLDYPAGSHSITIMGSLPIPEFGQFVLIAAIALPALLLRARRLGRSTRQT